MNLRVQKVKSVRIFQEVVDQLQGAIIKGDLKPGEVLPSEQKLKEMFDTGRGTIREALRVLECLGLVEVRAGSAGGPVVREPDAGIVAGSLDLLLKRQGVCLAELAEFREGVEAMIIQLASQRMTEQGLDRLSAIVDQARQCQEAGSGRWPEFVEADASFHLELAHQAGNKIYESVLRMIHGVVSQVCRDVAQNGDGLMLEVLDDLNRITRALKREDAAEAVRAMQAHVSRSNRYLLDAEKN